MNRKHFLSLAGVSALGMAIPAPSFSNYSSFKNKISLAQWSMNASFFSKKENIMDFALLAASMGFSGVEYVNQFFFDTLKNGTTSSKNVNKLARELNMRANDNEVSNVLIMLDEEGSLSHESNVEITKAIEQHKKWVELAAELGCESVRVNLSGTRDEKIWINQSVVGLTGLCEFAKPMGINVIVENHGGLSSNAGLLAQVMKQTNLDNCGTLPDFGNFCLASDWGSEDGCKSWYDMYKGVAELMPYAKSVSAKAYDFDKNGNETKIDYAKMMQIVKNNNYKGYIGVEYEGSRLSEKEGILATKNLIQKFI
ncbi:MAG: TIM barrel protein [Flavobacteriaceae bacterium]